MFGREAGGAGWGVLLTAPVTSLMISSGLFLRSSGREQQHQQHRREAAASVRLPALAGCPGRRRRGQGRGGRSPRRGRGAHSAASGPKESVAGMAGAQEKTAALRPK